MSDSNTATILIVDDNIGARRSIEGLLASEGYQLILAERGEEALQIANHIHPDLILLDVMMPGMSGYEVCETVRENAELSEVPIIMITALDDEESMIKGIDAGADDFLTKPINKLELRSRVRGVTRLNRYRKLCGERQKFEWVVENSSFGYLVLDPIANIAFSNPKAREILHLPLANEPQGANFFYAAQNHYEFKPADFQETWLDPTQRAPDEPLILLQPQTPEQPARWFRVSFMDIEGIQTEHTLARLADITQSMQNFQERHTFSRMISHKLLTPLNALKAAQQMMTLSQDDKSEQILKTVTDLQNKGIERLEYDIDSIIRFLQSNSNDTPTDRCRLITLSEQLKRLIEESGIPFGLITDLQGRGQTRVSLSEYSFEACVREIVENAIKFHPDGAPNLDCSVEVDPEAKQVLFTFKNDGLSLSDEDIENAWKPYWQADRFLTGEIKGMGLGLALVATNIWAAGGTCSIANRKSTRGAVVELKLPLP
ncbi:MAG: response regulator [Verrucomicrobiota bacterium]